MPKSHRYLIYGQPRTLLADALLEYREFAAANPDEPLAAGLLDVAREVHLALHEERHVLRATGTAGKVNERHQVDQSDRKRLAAKRRVRLNQKALAAC